MKLIYLSHPLSMEAPRPPAIPAPELTEFMNIERDGASVHRLAIYSHVGTHLDTAAHVIEGGRHITQYAPEELVFRRPVLVDLRVPDDTVIAPEHFAPYMERLQEADFLILRLGLEEVRAREHERFSRHSPGLEPETGRFLVNSLPKLRGFGMDAPSLAAICELDRTMTVHQEMLSARDGRFLVVEEMKLDALSESPRALSLHPWLVEGMHSGPCSVTALVETEEN